MARTPNRSPASNCGSDRESFHFARRASTSSEPGSLSRRTRSKSEGCPTPPSPGGFRRTVLGRECAHLLSRRDANVAPIGRAPCLARIAGHGRSLTGIPLAASAGAKSGSRLQLPSVALRLVLPRRRAEAQGLGAGAAAAKGVDAAGPRRGRGRPTRQRRCSGGWRRTRPQTELAESEERDPPTGPARHRLQALERARATRVADPAPPARATPPRQPLAATGRPARERAPRARAARGSRSRRRAWSRGRPTSPASRRSCAARTSRRRWARPWSP
jgi:hypothetical protein